MKILLGSNNRHKAEEIKDIISLSNLVTPIDLFLLNDIFSNEHDVIEDGKTLEENSLKKAKEYFELLQKNGFVDYQCIADDTGLEIDYLNGEPGVYSARYAGADCRDENNRIKVLKELSGIPAKQRTARFRTIICHYNKNGYTFIEGKCEGKIAINETGDNGFGYDSIFIPTGFSQSFAEMNSEEKNELSHRGNAIRNWVQYLAGS